MDGAHKERYAIKNVYPKSEGWSDKVDRMSDAQVIAIYAKFRAQGKLGK